MSSLMHAPQTVLARVLPEREPVGQVREQSEPPKDYEGLITFLFILLRVFPVLCVAGAVALIIRAVLS